MRIEYKWSYYDVWQDYTPFLSILGYTEASIGAFEETVEYERGGMRELHTMNEDYADTCTFRLVDGDDVIREIVLD